MLKRQNMYWTLGFAMLAGLYALVVWYGWHRPVLPPVDNQTSSQPRVNEKTITLHLAPGVDLDMIRIPAGEFVMGSPDTEEDRDPSEGPQHIVHIQHSFYMGKFAVTQAQWIAVMKDNQSQFKGPGDLPAEQVSWDDCQKFCQIVTQRTGWKVRLPSEAEWEYACRAGTTTPFSFGSTLSSSQANFNGEAPYGDVPAGPKRGKTMPVGSFKPNAFGLYDMHGNVWQWCQDVFNPDYTGAPTDGSVWNHGPNPDIKVYRGGAWDNDGKNCRSAIRYATDHNTRTNVLGFRVAADLAASN